jgi:hypothetical protein
MKTNKEIYNDYDVDPIGFMEKHGCKSTSEITIKLMEMAQAQQKTNAIEPVVSQRDAKEWGEFIIRCDREGSPLLLLEDYIDQYCSQ